MSIIGVGWDCLKERERVLVTGESLEWGSIHASVTGASHLRQGQPNQDAIEVFPPSATARRKVVAVADGHGHTKHFRSEHGSRFAVQAAIEAIAPLLSRYTLSDIGQVKTALEDEIPGIICDKWQERVAVDVANSDFSEQELSLLPAGEFDVFQAYGSTLVVAVATEHFLYTLRIGDGDILAVDGGEKVRSIIPPSDDLPGEAVDSLCDRLAASKFRHSFELHDGPPPAAILLSTDGYSKSFPSARDNFLKVGSDILRYLRDLGPEEIAHDLPDWLATTSADGSGDDITLGILYRIDALSDRQHG